MAVAPDKLMEMIKNQRDGATPKGVPPTPEMPSPGMSDSATPPMGAPMSTPEPKMGNKEGAMVNLSMAMDLLKQSLPAVGADTDEGKKILAAIRTITGVLGSKQDSASALQPSEILQMLQTLPQAGGATPEGKAMAQAPAIPGMAAPAPSPVAAPSPQPM